MIPFKTSCMSSFEEWARCMKRVMVRFYVKSFIMSRSVHVHVVNVVIIDPTWKIMFLNVISWLSSATLELSAVAKIRKYRKLQEGHYFILMAMEVHVVLGHDMDCSIRKCVCLSHNKRLKGHCSLFFTFNFSSSMLKLLFRII
jgi:hypothetical protein